MITRAKEKQKKLGDEQKEEETQQQRLIKDNQHENQSDIHEEQETQNNDKEQENENYDNGDGDRDREQECELGIKETEENTAMMRFLARCFDNMEKKIDETKEEINNSNIHMEKKMEKVMQENNIKMVLEIENKMEKINENLMNKIEILKQEMIQDVIGVERKLEKKIEETQNNVKNEMEKERTERKTEMINAREEIDNRIEQVALGVIENAGHVQVINERWRNDVTSYHGYIDDHINRKNRLEQEYIEKTFEEQQVKMEEQWRKMKDDIIRDTSKNRTITGINGDMGIKFNGKIKELHPCSFVESLKNKLRYTHNIGDIKEVIRANLRDSPSIWFSSIEEEINTFDDFEKKFLGYYWGEIAQGLFREDLYFSKYNYKYDNDLVNYALKLYTVAKYMKPKMQEEEIVLNIARHYEDSVVETITIQNIRSMQQFITILTRIQRGKLRPENTTNIGRERSKESNFSNYRNVNAYNSPNINNYRQDRRENDYTDREGKNTFKDKRDLNRTDYERSSYKYRNNFNRNNYDRNQNFNRNRDEDNRNYGRNWQNGREHQGNQERRFYRGNNGNRVNYNRNSYNRNGHEYGNENNNGNNYRVNFLRRTQSHENLNRRCNSRVYTSKHEESTNSLKGTSDNEQNYPDERNVSQSDVNTHNDRNVNNQNF